MPSVLNKRDKKSASRKAAYGGFLNLWRSAILIWIAFAIGGQAAAADCD